MYKKVGIIGLGLIGGSLAKALKSRCNVEEIVACNRSKDVLETAFSQGVIDKYALDVTDIFKGCELVIICTPVDKIFEYAKKLTNFIDKDCIVTDVGSTKENIFKQMQVLSNKFIYIGGHPMTGSEKFRYHASKDYMFENAYYILTPNENVKDEAIKKLKSTIKNIGAIPIIISPFEHDYITAAISHMPHIIASSIVNTVKKLDNNEELIHLLAAGGFRDTTRIASSSPDMWEGICIENKENILKVLDLLIDTIQNVKKDIENEEKQKIYNFFDTARVYRDSFITANPKKYSQRFEISVGILDKPGSLAIIAVLLSSNGINIKNMAILNSREHDEGVLHLTFDSEEQRQKSVKILESMNYEVFIK